MTDLLGYFELTDDCGCPLEVMNHCRTLTYINGQHCAWQAATSDCEDCCCAAHDDGYGTSPSQGPNVAPWADVANPASDEFLGLYGDLTLGKAQADTAAGQVWVNRITFSGFIVSTSRRGTVFGNQWLNRMLNPFCGSCLGQEAKVFLFCGDGADTIDASGGPDNPRPDPNFGRDCCDCDDVPEPLGISPAVATNVDTGERNLMRVKYVDNSYLPLEEDPIPNCFGQRITFSFDVQSSHTYTEPTDVCTFGYDLAGEPVDAFEGAPCAKPCVCSMPEEDDCGRCGWPCECNVRNEVDTIDAASFGLLNDTAAACRWSAPLCSKRITCVTPPMPFEEAVPVVTITAGAEPVYGMSVTLWSAHPGLPDPGTCLGAEIYANRAPIGPPALLTIPAGTTMRLDGRTGAVMLDCDGTRGAGSLAATCDSSRLTIPTVRCNERIWVAIDADCYNLPGEGFVVDVQMSGKEPI